MRLFVLVPVLIVALSAALLQAAESSDSAAAPNVFAKDNLVAWCIVPFDANSRSPQERAEMLVRLGIRRLAYDWRPQHVPTFEDEIVQMKRHQIDFFAFWGTHPDFTELMQKHAIQPQFWVVMHSPDQGTHEQKIEEAARHLLPVVEQTRQWGCKLALYNHGGWAGQPANMVGVAEWLRVHQRAEHVGIVYNLHHGHEHIAQFAEVLALMQPYLFCLNLNGMNENEQPKILPLGQGQHDLALLRIIRDSGYAGPIGILDHRADMDAEEALRLNLDGLKDLLRQLDDQAALSTYR